MKRGLMAALLLALLLFAVPAAGEPVSFAGLTADGIIGSATWNALYDRFLGINRTTGLAVPYPGTPLKAGSRGDNVRLVQEYLNVLSRAYPLPRIAADGIYGPSTSIAVSAFQAKVGLPATGNADVATQERLFASDAPLP